MKMKFMWGALMAIAFASCTQEDVLRNGHGVNTLTASMEKGVPESRVGFTDSQAEFFWTKGDKIGVTTAESQTFQGMTLVGEGGTTTGTFSASMNAAASGYAVYPYGAFGRHSVSSNVLTYVLPATYNYESLDETYAKADGNSHNAPMWGKISDGTVNFKHLGGVIAFSISGLPEKTEGLQFVLTATNQISGSFSATLTESEPKIATATSNVAEADKKVTITFKTAEGQTSGYFYVPVPTGDLGTLDLVILNGEDEVATGSWGNVTIARKDIRRATIGNQTIIGGNGEIKLVTSVDQVNNALTTSEENLIVQVSGEVTGDNDIEIPTTLDTETTTFSFASVADGAKITIENADGGSYDGKIIIEIPENETIPDVVANIPDGEVYIKQGTVTTLVTSSKQNTTIIGAKAVIGTLTVVKGNVRIEDGGKVTKIERSSENTETVYVVYESATAPEITLGEDVVLMSAAEWDLRKAIEENGNVILNNNITLNNAIIINKAVTIDLNGYTIENKSANNTSKLGNVADECIVFYVDGESANLTLNATNGGKVIATGDGEAANYNVAVWVTNGATTTINGGEYYNTADTEGDGCDLIYGRDGGKIYVTGGTFKAGAIRKTLGGGIYGVLNCKDTKGSKITVSGGKFYEYGATEASKVGSGEVILLEDDYYWSAKDAEGYYTVSKDITTEEALKLAITRTENVKLGANITLTDAITINKTVTIDLNGYTIENKSANNTSKLGNVADECIVFYVDGESANLTLNATNGGKVIATGDGEAANYNVAVWVTNGATTTINGGEYYNTADTEGDGCDLIYGRDGGKIYVTGGTFKAGAIRKTLGGGIYGVLNCKDTKGSKITVSGGKFYEYGATEASKVGSGEVILLEPGYVWTTEKDKDNYFSVVPASE